MVISARKLPSNITTHTYNSAGGANYSSLATWESATDDNLVSLTRGNVLEIQGTGHDDTVLLAGATCNSTYFRVIRPASGNEHDGTRSVVHIASTATGNVLRINESYSCIHDISARQTINSTSTTNIVIGAGSLADAGTTFIGCLVTNSQNSGTGNTHGLGVLGGLDATGVGFVDCMAETVEGAGFRAASGAVSFYAYNCTSVGNNTYGFEVAAANGLKAVNCLASGNTTAGFGATGSGSWPTGTNYNASSDGSAPGANSRTSQTFTFVNAGSNNYHLSTSDAGAKGYGTDLSGDATWPFDDDIDGDLWGATWDIGFDHPVSSGVSVTPDAIEAVGTTVDPTVVLGALTLTPSSSDAPGTAVDPTVVLGALSITPAAIEALGETVDPSVILGALSITPASADATGETADPTVHYGSDSAAPAAVEAAGETANPAVVLGSLMLVPDVVEAAGTTVDPDVAIGSPPITPDAVEAAGSTVDPTAVLGALSITPAAVEAAGETVDPTLVFGSLTVTPAAEEAASTTVDPTTILGALAITPASADATGETVDPSVQEGGNLSVTPAAVSAPGETADPAIVLGSITLTPAAEEATGTAVNPNVHYGSTSAAPAAVEAAGTTVDPTVINSGPVITPAAVEALGTTVNPTLSLDSISITPAAAGAAGETGNPSVLPELVIETSNVISNNRTWLPVQDLTQDALRQTMRTLDRPPPEGLDADVSKVFNEMRGTLRYLFEAFEKQVSYNDKLRLGVDDAIRAVHQRVDLGIGAGNLSDRPPAAPDGIRYTAVDEDPPVTYVAKDGAWIVAA